jgi:HMG-box domain
MSCFNNQSNMLFMLRDRQAAVEALRLQTQSTLSHLSGSAVATSPVSLLPQGLSAQKLLRLRQIQQQRQQIRLARASSPSTAIETASSILRRHQSATLLPTVSATHQYQLPSEQQLLRILASSRNSRFAAGLSPIPTVDLSTLSRPLDSDSTPPYSSSQGQASMTSAGKMELVVKKPALKPSRKKPKDQPRRALSAYNIFFKEERQRILADIPSKRSTEQGSGRRGRNPHGKIGFENLARLIGQRWQELGPDQVQYYKAQSDADKERHAREMQEYQRNQARVLSTQGGEKRKAELPVDLISDSSVGSEQELSIVSSKKCKVVDDREGSV